MADAEAAANEPRKNHYIPQFYLRRWAGSDGRVCEYSRPPGNPKDADALAPVKALRRHPAQTGFELDLYSLPALTAGARAFLETEFFRQVDQHAANALEQLTNSNVDNLTADQRSGWARFILSMVHRTPQKIQALREHTYAAMKDAVYATDEGRAFLEAQAEKQTSEEDLAALIVRTAEVHLARLVAAIIDSDNVGNHIIEMRWSVLSVTNPIHDFMTSDRPVVMTDGINKPDSFIIVPMGPKQVFVACRTLEAENHLKNLRLDKFMAGVNDNVARQAAGFVYGTNDLQLRFVENRLGRNPAQFIAGKALVEAIDKRATHLRGKVSTNEVAGV